MLVLVLGTLFTTAAGMDCESFAFSVDGPMVCASDGRNYINSFHVLCENYRNALNLTVISEGPCQTSDSPCDWSAIYRPVCANGTTFANLEAFRCFNLIKNSTLKLSHRGECKEQDYCRPTRKKTIPVCGSNGHTYDSTDELRCLAKHDSSVIIRHEGGCTVAEVEKQMLSRERICFWALQRYEWNPICSSNNETVVNPYIFLCYNPFKTPLFTGECNSEIHKTCIKAKNSEIKHEDCKNCLVCGSDGREYHTADHLKCASRFDSNLRMLHVGRCKISDCPCSRAVIMDKGRPVCGSDGITYSTPEALHCITKTKDKYLEYVHEGRCIPRRLL